MSQTPRAFIKTFVRDQSHTSPVQRYKIYHRSPNSQFKQSCLLQSLLHFETSPNHAPNHFLFKSSLHLTLQLNTLCQKNIIFGEIFLDVHNHFIIYYERTSGTRTLAQIQTKHHI